MPHSSTAARAAAPGSPTVVDPLVPPLNDTRRLVAFLAEFLELSPEEVCRRLRREEKFLGTEVHEQLRKWNFKPYEWSDELARFYRESPYGLASGVVWNRRREKLAMRQWIGTFLQSTGLGISEVLTVGDGSGFDSLFLASCGHRVTFSDESADAKRFATKLFESAGLWVRMADKWSNYPDESFDVVVCLDVLEHTPDPRVLVAEFARLLRPGGRLIVHAPFFFVSWHNPTHLRCNIRYSGSIEKLYGRYGLKLEAGRPFWDPLALYKPGGADRPITGSSWQRAKLRLTGALLSTARIWRRPHNWVAARAMQEGDSRWLQELAAVEESNSATS
jgi:SAM-dependent methyltransferase